MPLKIYNTLTKKKEEFKPLVGNKVGMYACGPTVYGLIHVGNARKEINFDFISRYLRFKGFDVTYVQNITDIDDRIIQRANEDKCESSVIAKKYTDEFEADMAALGLQKPEVSPKATDHIPEIIAMISKLIQKKHAYVVDGEVFYSISSFKNYGKLSGKKIDELQAGSRVEVDKKKQNPFDFTLWKPSKPDEPFWESPWGKGRPGWHIECSAMSMKYLGDSFDIHGGGIDLIFPHHENEIAQSEGCTEKPFSKFWMHNEFITMNDEKMSKSVGNIFLLQSFLKAYGAEVLKFIVLSHHYRTAFDFSQKKIDDAITTITRVYRTLAQNEPIPTSNDGHLEFESKFFAALDDDFNTAEALGHLFEALHDPKNVAQFKNSFQKIKGLLGVFNQNPRDYLNAFKQKHIRELNITECEIQSLISDRITARTEKNWKKSDDIRDILLQRGIVLKDSKSGTEWDIA